MHGAQLDLSKQNANAYLFDAQLLFSRLRRPVAVGALAAWPPPISKGGGVIVGMSAELGAHIRGLLPERRERGGGYDCPSKKRDPTTARELQVWGGAYIKF